MKNNRNLFAHGGDIYGIKSKVLDFSANINPLGMPANVMKILQKETSALMHYPDPQARGLVREIAGYWNIKEENVCVGNGSTELIYLLFNVFRPKEVTFTAPSFTEYERAARLVKARIKFIPLSECQDFSINQKRIKECANLFLCNPNNPTGNLITDTGFEIKNIPAQRIFIDEAFMDFVCDENKHSLIREAARSKKLIIFRTLTKFFAIPGLRAGYLIAHRDIIKNLKRYQMPWSVNSLAQLAAEQALKEKQFIRVTKQFIKKEKMFLYNSLNKINGIKPYPTVVNFILIKIEQKRLNSSSLKERLLKKGILIRDCANFRGLDERFVRVAVRSRKENIRLLEALCKSL